jgi:hypothetical protein
MIFWGGGVGAYYGGAKLSKNTDEQLYLKFQIILVYGRPTTSHFTNS